jgi:hypothetical protein
MKKTYKSITLLLAAATVILLSACAQNPSQNDQQNTQANSQESASQQLIGGQKDDHGCLSGAGYRWCSALNKCVRAWEEFCADLVPETLNDLKDNSQIKFADIVDTDMVWKVKKTSGIISTIIKGKSVLAKNLAQSDFDKIGAYMLSNGFEPDLYNTGLGTGSGIDSYTKANIGLVCTINYTLSEKIPATAVQQTNLKRDVMVACGILPKA